MTNAATTSTASRAPLAIRFHAAAPMSNDNASSDADRLPSETKSGKTITVRNIKRRDSTMFGKVHTGETMIGHHAVITPGESIRLHGIETNRVNGPVAYDKTYRIGDVAEYDSYNLSYFGRIVAIGAKSVTIEAHGSKSRLDIAQFSWRNRLFDVKEESRKNSEWMD